MLVIEDDGVGFSSDDVETAKGVGLGSMRERAALIGATLHVESTLDKGTSIFLRWPVPRASQNGAAT